MNRLLTSILFFFLCISLFAQKHKQGMVANEYGLAIPFATVYTLDGKGTTCDSLGYFKLEIAEEQGTIILFAQAMGYVSDTVLLTDNNSAIGFRLKESQYQIGEVSVISHQKIEYISTVSAFTTNKKEMELQNPKNVCQVLQTKSGFTNKSGYQAPLVLRGMSGKRILVLRNSNRRFSSYPAGVMSHTINVYDLERIEVEKGASSVIYGAGAMAGIINLVDKSPFKQNGFNAKVTSGYGSVNNEKNGLACGGWSNGKFAIKAGIRYRSANNYTYPDREMAENSFYTDKDIFITTGYKFSELKSLVFTADFHDGGPWGKPVGFNGSDYMRVQTHKEKSNNYSLRYTQGNVGLFQHIEFSTCYSNESRQLVKNYYTAAGYMLSYTETTHFSDYYYGALIKGNIKVNSRYKIITGAEAYSFHISTPVDVVDYIEGMSYKNRVSNEARSNTSGVFMENNFSLSSKAKLIAGIRYNFAKVFEGDVYSTEQLEERKESKSALSWNAATVIKLSKSSKVKLNITQSFRMPETTELYTDNYTSNGILYGNPNLEPEFCYSTDMSYQLKTNYFDFEVSPFLWFMNNMITKEEITGLPGTNYTYVNIGKTRLFGGEATATLRFGNVFSETGNLSFRTGLAYLNGTDITDTKSSLDSGTPLDYMPPLNVKSEVNYSCMLIKKLKLNFALRTVYYSEQKRLGESGFATPSYFILGGNLGLSMPKLKTKPSLNIAVNNLTNKEYYCYLSYLPSEGRDVRVFLTLNF